MLVSKKKLTGFKGKVKRKIKSLKRELKARLDYAERLNQENNKLVETNFKAINNMQATIDQKDKDLEFLKAKHEVEVMLLKIWEDKFDTLMNCFNATEEERKEGMERIAKLKQQLEIANNRIKYEFKGD